MGKPTKKQRVRFDFFQLVEISANGAVEGCDIADFLQKINAIPVSERSRTQFGEPTRMDKIHTESTDANLTYFHMVRLRDEGLASANEVSEELNDIDLDAGDYVAEDINCIFDSGLCVLMIQRNFHSLSISGVREYLVAMYKTIYHEDVLWEFRPVQDREALSKALTSNAYRKISFRFAANYRSSLPKVLTKLTGEFGQIFSSFGGNNLTITIGADRSKPDLHGDEAKELINAISENKSMFSSALISGKQGDAPVEIYDILQGKYSKYCEFTSYRSVQGKNKKVHLAPASVEGEMLQKYSKEGCQGTVAKYIS